MAIFMDTSYIPALLNTADEYHEHARFKASDSKGPFVTTEAVLTEIGNALSKLRWPSMVVSTLEDLRKDPDIEIISIDSELFDSAVKLYGSRMGKEWGVTDCLSFIVMEDKGIISALSTDEYFKQVGFQVLLLG